MQVTPIEHYLFIGQVSYPITFFCFDFCLHVSCFVVTKLMFTLSVTAVSFFHYSPPRKSCFTTVSIVLIFVARHMFQPGR